jgi:esterase/lipase superfamily enzyme
MSHFIISLRNREGDQYSGEDIASASYLDVPENADVPNVAHKVTSTSDWLQRILNCANQPTRSDIVFFVHGYNNTAEEALQRQRLIETNLAQQGYPCIVIGLDWPTNGNVVEYLNDRTLAGDAARLMVNKAIIPFTKFSRPDCTINVHVMAHSMGAYLVREAFRDTEKRRSPDIPSGWRIGQLIFFAADISSDCFEDGNTETLPLFTHSGRVTNYYNGHDIALAASNVKNLDISSRLGRVGMPDNAFNNYKAIDVDCSKYFGNLATAATPQYGVGVFSHSWYFNDPHWYKDLAYTLRGQIDRTLIPTRKPASGASKNDFILT